MAGGWSKARGSRGAAQRTSGGAADIAVVADTPGRRLALGLMIVASASALLATTTGDGRAALYSFEKSSEAQHTVLTQSAPLARHVVRVRATALGPEGVLSTESAQAVVHGTVSVRTTSNGASPFVRVRLETDGQTSDEVAAVTSFQLSHALRFSGNCAHPEEGPPCEAELGVDLDVLGTTLVAASDVASIDWQVDVSSRAFRHDGNEHDEQPSAPWTIEVEAR